MISGFPTTYHHMHADANLNFQLNRCLTWTGEGLLPDLAKAAVLDHLALHDVTLIGMSLGGCLSLRAAAFDALFDFYDALLGRAGSRKRILDFLLDIRAGSIVNRIATASARGNLLAAWGMEQGMHVTGTTRPYEYLRTLRKFHTRDVSPLITQDVLVLGGTEDHFVPVQQFHQQIKALTAARSVTARLFTREEQASSHCQVGNVGLALTVMLEWLAERSLASVRDRGIAGSEGNGG